MPILEIYFSRYARRGLRVERLTDVIEVQVNSASVGLKSVTAALNAVAFSDQCYVCADVTSVGRISLGKPTRDLLNAGDQEKISTFRIGESSAIIRNPAERLTVIVNAFIR
ncbi:hypothetical protein A2Y99_00670 [Candidatus Gottesmanbacteria bacterium RBG_13_37_7]|uniref:Uncharacterized protein n=1 Tax=Candidatus Gottesmanbacteria bacterium RBG_13_37_7 TaxID=1798369 RepID=A0A1F5YG32_9BACT|nr:MAG: hypothetical protein A2Y99_00670 [Candidatus Gottesmanbacteria bacterium RBG_13_37_7]